MWDSLASQECERFREYARAYGVTYVMTVDTRTPKLQAGQCSVLPARFSGVYLQIYRVSWR